MAPNIVFLVHGMGRNFAVADGKTPAWSDEVIRTLDQAWSAMPALADLTRSELIEYVPITYDDIFREYLAELRDASARVRQYLPAGVFAEVFDVLKGAGADETNFFWDNISDVLDYLYGADRFRLVHVRIAEAIASKAQEVWAKHQNATFSVVTHSLGTATTHGALNRLGGGNLGDSAAFKLGGRFRLRAYVSLANVSRLLWQAPGELYQGTIVRPFSQHGGAGYVDYFLNVRHIADPIAAPKPFAPTDWGTAYQSLTIKHLRNVNVHGFTHYLGNPAVSGQLFRAVLGDAFVTAADVAQASAGFPDLTLSDPTARANAEKLVADLGKTLHDVYGADQALLWSIPKLVAHVIRDLWTHVQALQKVLGAKP